MLPSLSPAKLSVARDVFVDPDWIYELKYDGFRGLAYFDRGKSWLVSRNNFTYKRFSPLCEHLGHLLRLGNAILDGEIVCIDDHGRPRFYDLMFQRGEPRFFAFDILWKDGEDLRSLPLTMRKKILRKLIPKSDARLLYVDHSEDGHGLFRLVCEQDLEGMVMKPKASPYGDNRWLKIKNANYSQAKDRHELFNRK